MILAAKQLRDLPGGEAWVATHLDDDPKLGVVTFGEASVGFSAGK